MPVRKGNKVMFLRHKNFVLGGVILVLFLLLVACGYAGSDSSNGNTGTGSTQDQGSTPSAIAAATITPQQVTPKQVTPKASKGTPGKGPVAISSPTPVPGGKAGSQQIVLRDRTLIINTVSKQKGASPNSTLINLDLAIQNTSHAAINNHSPSFQFVA